MLNIALNSYFANKPNVGFGVLTNNLINYFENNSTNHNFTLYSDTILNSKLKQLNLPALKFLSPLKGKAYFEYFSIPNSSKNFNYDIFHSLYPSISTPKCKIHIVSLLDLIYRIMPECNVNNSILLYNLATEAVAKNADIIHTISQVSKLDIMKFLNIPEERIKVIYPGISDIYRVKKDKDVDISKFNIKNNYLLYAGGFDKRKNVKFLIDAFEEIHKLNPNLDLVIAGKIPDKFDAINFDYKSYIKNLSSNNNIIFTGYVSEEDLCNLYNKTTLFIFPSLHEGFGLTPIEAMKCGAPTLVSNSSSMPEVCGDGAFYFDPYNLKDFIKFVMEILNSNEKLNTLKEKGVKQAHKYSLNKYGSQMLNLYEESIKIKPLNRKSFFSYTLSEFINFKRNLKENPPLNNIKILVFRPDQLGDVVLTTPIYENLKKAFPQSTLYSLTATNTKAILDNNPFIDKKLYFDYCFYNRGKNYTKFNKLINIYHLIKLVRNEKIDVFIDLKGHLKTLIISYLSGASFRIGKARGFRGLLLQKSTPYTEMIYEKDNNLNLIKLITPIIQNNINLYPIKTDNIPTEKDFIAILPFAPSPLKRLPKEYFIEIIKNIRSKVILLGGNDAIEFNKELSISISKFKNDILDLTGKLNITETFLLLKNARGIISLDTMGAHLGVVSEKPTFTIFTYSNPWQWMPLENPKVFTFHEEVPCRGCKIDFNTDICHNNNLCQKGISKENLLNAISDFLRKF